MSPKKDLHYPDLSKQDLQDKIKAYKSKDSSAKTTGNKSTLDELLHTLIDKHGELGEGDVEAATTEASLGRTRTKSASPDKQSNKVSSPSKRGPKLKSASTGAPAKPGAGQASVLYRPERYLQITIDCLEVLDVCPVTVADAEIDDENAGALAESMQPALELCQSLSTHSSRLRDGGLLKPSPSVNMCKLQEAMLPEVNLMLVKYSENSLDGRIKDLFRMFTKDVSPPTPGFAPRPEGTATSIDDREEAEMEAAKQASLEDFNKELEKVQREVEAMQAESHVDGDGGRADLPGLTSDLLDQVLEDGIGFLELLRRLDIHLQDSGVLMDFYRELTKHVVVYDGKLFRRSGDAGGYTQSEHAPLTTDEQVRQTLSVAGERGMTVGELLRSCGVRSADVSAVENFEKSLIGRNIVKVKEGGRLMLSSSTQAPNPFTTAPVLQATPSTSSYTEPTKKATPRLLRPDDETTNEADTPSQTLSAPPQLRINTDITPRVFSSGSRGAAVDGDDEDDNTSLLSPGLSPGLSNPRLLKEVRCVREGISAHLRKWFLHFPQPAQGVYRDDFNADEAKCLRNYVLAHLISAKVLGNSDPDVIDKAAQELVVKKDFPIAKGKHKAAIIAVIKELNRNRVKQDKKKKAEAAAAAVSGAGRKRTADEVDSDPEDGAMDVDESPAPTSNLASSRDTQRKKARIVGDVEDDQDTMEVDFDAGEEGDGVAGQ